MQVLISLLKNSCVKRLRTYLFGFVFFGALACSPPPSLKGREKANCSGRDLKSQQLPVTAAPR